MLSSRGCCQSSLPRRLARAARACDVPPLTGVPNFGPGLRSARARRDGSRPVASFSITARSSSSSSSSRRRRKVTRIGDAAPLLLLPLFLSPKRSTTAVGGLSTSFVQKAHAATYSLKKKAKYACMTCAKSYASMEHLERHAKRVGHRTATQLPPELISAVTSSEGNSSSVFTRLLPHHCKYCSKGFRKHPDLRNHIRVAHPQGPPPVQKTDASTENPIDEKAIMASLRKMCHSPGALAAVGHFFERSVLEDARLCVYCKKKKAKAALEAQHNCQYHPQPYESTTQVFPCCSQPALSEGCKSSASHKFKPIGSSTKEKISKGMKRVPAASGGGDQDQKPAAVALACGMKPDTNKLYSICAVDFLSGKILLNKYVRVSGLPKQAAPGSEEGDINDESLPPSVPPGGERVRSFRDAREELFNIIGPETILLGHGLRPAINEMKISHDLVADSLIIARRVTRTRGSWELGNLTSVITSSRLKEVDLLRIAHQNAHAVRDLMMHVAQYPGSLAAWAYKQTKKDENYRGSKKRKNDSSTPQAPRPRDEGSRSRLRGRVNG